MFFVIFIEVFEKWLHTQFCFTPFIKEIKMHGRNLVALAFLRQQFVKVLNHIVYFVNLYLLIAKYYFSKSHSRVFINRGNFINGNLINILRRTIFIILLGKLLFVGCILLEILQYVVFITRKRLVVHNGLLQFWIWCNSLNKCSLVLLALFTRLDENIKAPAGITLYEIHFFDGTQTLLKTFAQIFIEFIHRHKQVLHALWIGRKTKQFKHIVFRSN